MHILYLLTNYIILIWLQVCCHWAVSVDHKWKPKRKLYCNHRKRY